MTFSYIIELQDRFSRIIEQAGGRIRNTSNLVERLRNRLTGMADQTTARNRVLSMSYDQIQARMRQVENTIRTSRIPSEIRAARRELELLQRQSNNHPGRIGAGGGGTGRMGMFGGLGKMAGTLGLAGMLVGGTYSLGKNVLDFSSDSISKSLERQQIQTSFDVLAGGKEQGGALTKQLVGLQKDTILGGEVFKNAQTMMGFGFDSSEVYNNLKMLGDVSMGDANKLQSLTLAFSQIRAAGKLAGQDLLQLINAGFNPLETMSQKTGKSIGALKEIMEKGNITFEHVQQAFKDATGEGGRFENMLSKIAETPAGKVQQLSGEWDEFKISAGNAFMPLVSMALDFASQLLPLTESVIAPLTAGVEQVAGWITNAKSATSGWMDYVSILGDLFSNTLVPFAMSLWEAIKNIVNSVLDFVAGSQLVRAILGAIVLYWSMIYEIVGKVIEIISWLFTSVLMPILDVFDTIYLAIRKIIVAVVEWISKFEIVQKVISVVKAIVSGVKDFISGVVDSLKELYETVVVPIINAYNKLKGWVGKTDEIEIKHTTKNGIEEKAKPSVIEIAKIPGTLDTGKNSYDFSNSTNGGKSGKGASKSANNISTGGSKTTNISLTIGKLVETLNVNANNLREGGQKIRDVVQDELTRALISAQANM